MVNASNFARRLTRVPPAYFVFLALFLVIWAARPQMVNVNILSIFIRQVAPLGILVLGQLLAIRVRSIDLSGAGIILLVNYVISSGMLSGAPVWEFALISIFIGLAVGLFNGLMVGKRKSSAVIVTLAVNIILIGIVQFLASGKPPGDVPKIFTDLYNGRLFTIPMPIVVWVILALTL